MSIKFSDFSNFRQWLTPVCLLLEDPFVIFWVYILEKGKKWVYICLDKYLSISAASQLVHNVP